MDGANEDCWGNKKKERNASSAGTKKRNLVDGAVILREMRTKCILSCFVLEN